MCNTMYHDMMRKLHQPKNYGLLILRIGIGALFVAHGLAKIHGMQGTVGFFHTIGFSSFTAHVVAYVEFLGGIMLILGFLTRLAAWLLAIEMVVILLKFKFGAPLIGQGSQEIELALFSAASALGFLGGGKFALSRLVFRCKCGCTVEDCACNCKNGSCVAVAACDKCVDCANACTGHEKA